MFTADFEIQQKESHQARERLLLYPMEFYLKITVYVLSLAHLRRILEVSLSMKILRSWAHIANTAVAAAAAVYDVPIEAGGWEDRQARPIAPFGDTIWVSSSHL